jgi:hypothetical protein
MTIIQGLLDRLSSFILVIIFPTSRFPPRLGFIVWGSSCLLIPVRYCRRQGFESVSPAMGYLACIALLVIAALPVRHPTEGESESCIRRSDSWGYYSRIFRVEQVFSLSF